ncbi:MAG: hypothetical protein KDC92_17660, partial [Bacteroidetes bacterium]|nr:hypothetical protein [Bacteroidota bacterium]
MKHFTITLSILLTYFSLWAQNYSEDFESYEPFSRIAEQSENWRCWNHEYDKAKDAFVSDAEAHSGNNSLYLFSSRANGGPTDVVLDFGEAYASGEMEIEFWMFVKKESGGYFNFQGTHQDGKATALQCYLYGDSLFLDDMSTFYRTSFSSSEWHKINYQIDLTKGQWTMNIDDQEVASFTKTGINNSIAGIDFYPVNDDPSNNNSAYWVDDVTWSFTPYTFPTTNFAIVDADFRGGR